MSDRAAVESCRECGGRDPATFVEPTRLKMLRESLCFSCLHWTEWYAKRDEPETVRIDGSHYRIGPEHTSGDWFRGFGGRPFVICFHDGRTVKTTNLWHQGVIAGHFRARMPDNAVFVSADLPTEGYVNGRSRKIGAPASAERSEDAPA